MQKIIFLDMDGVIATPKTVEHGMWAITPECQDLLGQILEATKARLVITSSWRRPTVEATKERFTEKGFIYSDRIIGVTIRAYNYIEKGIHLSIPRGVEIKQWIDTNIHSDNGKNWERKEEGVDFNYVILDDDSDMLLEQSDYFIKTNWNIGLTSGDVECAIKILNGVT